MKWSTKSISILLFVVSTISFLDLNYINAKLESAEVLTNGKNRVYLFGDMHGFGHGSEGTKEAVQLARLKDIVGNQKKKITILVEDDPGQYTLKDNKLIDPHYVPDSFLADLVARIYAWKNNYVDVYGIECRSLLFCGAFHLFTPYRILPVDVTHFNSFNPCIRTFSDLMEEFEAIRKRINMLRDEFKKPDVKSFDVIATIVKNKMDKIDVACGALRNFLGQKGISLTSSLLDCYGKFLFKDMQSDVRIEVNDYNHNRDFIEMDENDNIIFPKKEVLLDKADRSWIDAASKELELFIKKYSSNSYGQDDLKGADAVIKNIYDKVWGYVVQETGDFSKVDIFAYMQQRRPLCKALYDLLHEVAVHIFDPIVYMNILKYVPQGSVVVFAGRSHTDNVKEMLLKSGFTECNDYGTTWEQLLPEEIAKKQNTAFKHVNVYKRSVRTRVMNMLTRTPVIAVLGILGAYLLARNNATSSVAGMIVGALSAGAAGGLTIAKICQSCCKRLSS
jgi:hypothetical protein